MHTDHPFSVKNTKDFQNYKGKKMLTCFFYFLFLNNLLAKIGWTGVMSRRSFRHKDKPNWLMSYFYIICVIWHKMSYKPMLQRFPGSRILYFIRAHNLKFINFLSFVATLLNFMHTWWEQIKLWTLHTILRYNKPYYSSKSFLYSESMCEKLLSMSMIIDIYKNPTYQMI